MNRNNFINILNGTETEFHPCDPNIHIENKTYHQLTYFDQAYIVNEANMNDDTCVDSCPELTSKTTEACNYDENFYCNPKSFCKLFHDCEFKGNNVYICITPNQSPLRIYDHFSYNEPQFCGGTWYSGSKWTRGFVKCDYCLCYCDDINEKSDRIMSLQKQEANIKNNEVMTGLRVVKLGQVFYLQIQVGQILPKRRINQKTVKWLPIKPITNISYSNDRSDYYILKRRATFDLDVFRFNTSYVLTGRVTKME